MDLWERRLQSLEADYRETIAAGERAEQRRRLEAIVAEHRAEYQLVSDHETEACSIETPAADTACESDNVEPRKETPLPQRIVDPLTPFEIERIKAHMSTVELKPEPSWARQISDQQLLELLNRVSR